MSKTIPFDPARYMESEEGHRDLLEDAFASGDPAYITEAFGIVARARGMTEIARESGVSRRALYKALSAEGDPRLSTLLGVAKALGVRLTVDQAERGPAPAATHP